GDRRRLLGRERDEDEAVPDVDEGPLQRVRRGVEPLRHLRRPAQRAVYLVRPAVVGADETRLAEPRLLGHDRRAAMAADIVVGHDPVVRTNDDQAVDAEVVTDPGATLAELRLVADEAPAAAEDPFQLELEDLGRCVVLASQPDERSP